MEEIEILAEELLGHRKTLETLMSEVPKVEGFPCKYFLFLTRLHDFTQPFPALYERLLEKQARQPDVFDLCRVPGGSNINDLFFLKSGVRG